MVHHFLFAHARDGVASMHLNTRAIPSAEARSFDEP